MSRVSDPRAIRLKCQRVSPATKAIFSILYPPCSLKGVRAMCEGLSASSYAMIERSSRVSFPILDI